MKRISVIVLIIILTSACAKLEPLKKDVKYGPTNTIIDTIQINTYQYYGLYVAYNESKDTFEFGGKIIKFINDHESKELTYDMYNQTKYKPKGFFIYKSVCCIPSMIPLSAGLLIPILSDVSYGLPDNLCKLILGSACLTTTSLAVVDLVDFLRINSGSSEFVKSIKDTIIGEKRLDYKEVRYPSDVPVKIFLSNNKDTTVYSNYGEFSCPIIFDINNTKNDTVLHWELSNQKIESKVGIDTSSMRKHINHIAILKRINENTQRAKQEGLNMYGYAKIGYIPNFLFVDTLNDLVSANDTIKFVILPDNKNQLYKMITKCEDLAKYFELVMENDLYIMGTLGYSPKATKNSTKQIGQNLIYKSIFKLPNAVLNFITNKFITAELADGVLDKEGYYEVYYVKNISKKKGILILTTYMDEIKYDVNKNEILKMIENIKLY